MTARSAKSKGHQAAALDDLLVRCAIDAIAWEGFENISMRAIAASAGATTAAIVHHFGHKTGLIEAACRMALSEEEQWHSAELAAFRSHPLAYLNFVEWTAQYIERRKGHAPARFWLELLFQSRSIEGSAQAIEEWRTSRIGFWSEIFREQGLDQSQARHIVSYLCMEEAWTQGLGGFREYPILLRETLRALLAHLFGVPWTEEDSVSDWLEDRLRKFAIDVQASSDSLESRLLDAGAEQIFINGISQLNQRRIAEQVGVAPSNIAHQFESMAAFRSQAVWRAMIRPVANPHDPYGTLRSINSVGDWVDSMTAAICGATGTAAPGFYQGFSRMIGEVSLLARRDPSLMPLVEHLRILDGTASYQASKTIWSSHISFARSQASAFALWLKGEAVLAHALGTPDAKISGDLLDVVTNLIPAAIAPQG